MPVKGVVVEVEFGVQRLERAISLKDQRIDLGKRGIAFHVAGVQALEQHHGLRHGSRWNADPGRQRGCLER